MTCSYLYYICFFYRYFETGSGETRDGPLKFVENHFPAKSTSYKYVQYCFVVHHVLSGSWSSRASTRESSPSSRCFFGCMWLLNWDVRDGVWMWMCFFFYRYLETGSEETRGGPLKFVENQFPATSTSYKSVQYCFVFHHVLSGSWSSRASARESCPSSRCFFGCMWLLNWNVGDGVWTRYLETGSEETRGGPLKFVENQFPATSTSYKSVQYCFVFHHVLSGSWSSRASARESCPSSRCCFGCMWLLLGCEGLRLDVNMVLFFYRYLETGRGSQW